MFAPGISRLVFARLGRQWPVVRAFFLKKSEARNSSPGIIQRDTAATEVGPPNTPKNAKKIRSSGWEHLRMQRDAIGGCQRNDQMPEAEPQIAQMTRMTVSMTKSE